MATNLIGTNSIPDGIGKIGDFGELISLYGRVEGRPKIRSSKLHHRLPLSPSLVIYKKNKSPKSPKSPSEVSA